MRLIKRGRLWYLETRIKPASDQPVKRHRISTGCEEKQDAIREAQKINQSLLEGAHSWRRQCPTMAEWWDTFYAEAAGRVAKTTYEDWPFKAKVLLKAFGKMRLNQITTTHCEQYRDEMLKKYKPGSVRSHMLLLMNVLNAALAVKHVTESPAHGVDLPKADRRRRVLSHDEQKKLIARLQLEAGSKSERERVRALTLRNMLVIALGTGLRIGTLAPLRKTNIVKADGATMIDVVTKGDKRQTIPVLPEVEQAIESQAQLAGESDRLFEDSADALREQLSRLRKRADVGHFTPHDLRRTFCTRLALGDDRLGIAPVPLPVLKELMGHSTVQITEAIYTVADGDAVKSRFLKGAAGALGLPSQAVGTASGTPA